MVYPSNQKTDMLAQFKNKVRLRVCGLLIKGEEVLLFKHKGVGSKGYLWAPPGGEVHFGENARQALVREFREEANISIQVGQFLLVNEVINNGFHALELFFEVKIVGGEIMLGSDPELPADQQILVDYGFFSLKELKLMDRAMIHNLFHEIDKPENFKKLKGFLSFGTM